MKIIVSVLISATLLSPVVALGQQYLNGVYSPYIKPGIASEVEKEIQAIKTMSDNDFSVYLAKNRDTVETPQFLMLWIERLNAQLTSCRQQVALMAPMKKTPAVKKKPAVGCSGASCLFGAPTYSPKD